METFWYFAVAAMLSAWVVLDGFDLGVGTLHLLVARTGRERRAVFASIGPVWDGNEVWLIAGGGTLFFAFPRAYAAGFSGFYLPLMLVLWLLAGRALSIELRAHLDHPLWHAFWDAVFALSSALLCVVLGAALGNVLRGVPLDGEGWFHVAFFTDFRLGPEPGVLDWYTGLIGLFALVALAGHGAHWLRLKLEGEVAARADRLAPRLWLAAALLGLLSIAATASAHPDLYRNLLARPLSWPFVLASMAGLGLALRGGDPLRSFLGSSAFLAGTLAATAAGAFPLLLRSSIDPAFSLTAANSAAAEHGLRIGLVWWGAGMPLAIAYAVLLYRSTRGKVVVD